jgi:hypothetical protein
MNIKKPNLEVVMGTIRRAILLIAVLGPAALAMSCDLFGYPRSGYVISGTVSGNSFSIATPIYLTVSDGSHSYSTSVYFPAGGLGESVAYSISNVPSGTYTISASFADTNASGSTYTVNSGSPVPLTIVPGLSGTTVSVSGLMITSTERIDINLGNSPLT